MLLQPPLYTPAKLQTPVFHNVGKARGMGPRLQLTASNFDAEKEEWGQPTPLSWAKYSDVAKRDVS